MPREYEGYRAQIERINEIYPNRMTLKVNKEMPREQNPGRFAYLVDPFGCGLSIHGDIIRLAVGQAADSFNHFPQNDLSTA